MKPFLALAAGFLASLALFVSGSAVAVYFLMAEPDRGPDSEQNVAQLWSGEPRSVDTAEQDLQRVAATADPETAQTPSAPDRAEGAMVALATPASAAESSPKMNDPQTADIPTIDTMTTAGLSPDLARQQTTETDAAIKPDTRDARQERPEPAREMRAAHVAWCSDRYRSYRPGSNSYTPYSGGQRACVSPYSDALGADATTQAAPRRQPNETLPVEYASYELNEGVIDAGMSADHINDCFSRYRSYRPDDNTYQPYGGGPRQQCR